MHTLRYESPTKPQIVKTKTRITKICLEELNVSMTKKLMHLGRYVQLRENAKSLLTKLMLTLAICGVS